MFANLEDRQGLNWLTRGHLWQQFFDNVRGFGRVIRHSECCKPGPGKAAFMSLETRSSDIRLKVTSPKVESSKYLG